MSKRDGTIWCHGKSWRFDRVTDSEAIRLGLHVDELPGPRFMSRRNFDNSHHLIRRKDGALAGWVPAGLLADRDQALQAFKARLVELS